MAQNRKYTIFEAADILYQVGNWHHSSHPVDYGIGEYYTSTEAHMLSYIVNNPGISMTQLAKDHNKTKGAVSQMIKKMVERGIVRQVKSSLNDRVQLLYVTDKGLQLHMAHKQYDTASYNRTYKALVELYSAEELNSALEIMDMWLQLRRQLGKF